MKLKVDVIWRVDDGVDELEAGQLEHGIVRLLQCRKDGVKACDVAQFSIDRHSFQDTIVSVEKVKGHQLSQHTHMYYMYMTLEKQLKCSLLSQIDACRKHGSNNVHTSYQTLRHSQTVCTDRSLWKLSLEADRIYM